jgi:predicted unusual protein kinase regulating ubiquinone biosynthesis (AarF/ABC1/UbiB family)
MASTASRAMPRPAARGARSFPGAASLGGAPRSARVVHAARLRRRRLSSAPSSPRVPGLLVRRAYDPSSSYDPLASYDGPSSLEDLDMERGACDIAPKYSPELVRERALASPREALATAARGFEIVLSAGVFAGGLVLDRFREAENVASRSEQLRVELARLGPSFVKAGQVLANRPDIVRADYMEQLTKLQDDVPAFDTREAMRIIERELGRSIDDVFSDITPEPIAAASLGQVYRATLRETGEEVAVKVQRPGIEPVIYRDLALFRSLAGFVNPISTRRLGCNAQLIVDEFGEKLLEELDYVQEGRNLSEFYQNFDGDPVVKIPKFYPNLSGASVLVMEWIDGVRCTDPAGIRASGVDVDEFIRVGVMSGLRQLLEFGLFHGDPHPGNIFAMRDGRIAYVDFGNVAQLSQRNKQTLIDAVVHAVNEDYESMAGDFVNLGFLAPGTDVRPIVPALESIWQDARTASMANFNFRTVTGAFNELVYEYPIRIPERFSLVIRSLLTQEGICMTLQPDFRFLEVAYPYVAKRLLTDRDASLRERLIQVLFDNRGKFQWKRLENLIALAGESGPGLDLTDTVADGAQLFITDAELRTQILLAVTEDDRLHVEEVARLATMLQGGVRVEKLAEDAVRGGPEFLRKLALGWSDKVLSA